MLALIELGWIIDLTRERAKLERKLRERSYRRPYTQRDRWKRQRFFHG